MLPERFVEMLRSLRLGDAAEAIAGADPEVSVRTNLRKPPSDIGNVSGQVSWCPQGVYLS